MPSGRAWTLSQTASLSSGGARTRSKRLSMACGVLCDDAAMPAEDSAIGGMPSQRASTALRMLSLAFGSACQG